MDPIRFGRGLLGHDYWGTQERIIRSVVANRRTAVKACHASSKTYTAADCVLWWPTRFDDGMVVTTAPTWTQVEKLLWGHVHRSVRSGYVKYPAKLNLTELKLGPDNYAVGISTNEGVRFQGWHGRMLIVLDEAPGVLPAIYEAIAGIRAGGDVHELLLGNPIVTGGPYFDAFHGSSALYSTITISAFDTPNLEGWCLDNGRPGDQHYRVGSSDPNAPNILDYPVGHPVLDDNVRPYLITRRYVREQWEEWGQGHPLWESKVLGQFPSQAEDSLIPLAALEACRAIIPGHEREPLRVGIDVAGPGEAETSVTVRQGPNRIAIRAWAKPDPRGDVAAFLAPMRERIEQINFDDVGDGYYFGPHFADLGYKVRGINVGSTWGVDTQRFTNQKAKYYWGLRERALQPGGLGGIDDPKEIAQLSVVKYRHTPRGQTMIVPKDEMRKLGFQSPDRAESDMLAYAPDEVFRLEAPPLPGSVAYSSYT